MLAALRAIVLKVSWIFKVQIMEGDSITDGDAYYSLDWRNLRNWTRIADRDPLTILAVAGSGINTVQARLPSAAALSPSLVTLLIGANDLYSYATGQAYYDACIAYFNTVRAMSPKCKFALAEPLPIDPNAAANSPPLKATQNAKRVTMAAVMRTRVGLDFDAIIPFGSAPVFPDAAAANPAMFADGLHPDGAVGRAVLVATYEACVAPFINGNFASTVPDDFTVTNVTAANTSTDYIIDFGPIKGLGVGKSVTFSKTSGTGTIARGNQDVGTAFGTTSLQLMNGDYGRVKITSSASASTAVSLTFDVGGRSKTATVTTATPPANTMIMNAADKASSLTVSGGGLTVSQASDPQAPRLVRSTIAFTGKRYAEMTINSRNGVFYPAMGVCNSTATLTGATPGDGNSDGGGSGPFCNIYPGPTYNLPSGGALQPGDVVMLAFDTTTHKLWMGVNGAWANTTDPATGVNGQDVGALANYYLWVSLQRVDNVTVNTGGSTFAYTPPAGFSAMP